MRSGRSSEGRRASSSSPVAAHGLVFYTTGWQNGHLLAVRPDGAGDATSNHIAWRVTRGAPKKPSVAIAGDLIYMIKDSGLLTCVDARSGAIVWTARFNGNYSASPLTAGNRGEDDGDRSGPAVQGPCGEFSRRRIHGLRRGRRKCVVPPGRGTFVSD